MNMDMTVVASRFPELGETVNGQSFSTAYGGKGANQAVAAARLGANVKMCACKGKDVYGEELKKALENDGVNTDFVYESGSSTGVAVITLVDGDNTIIVAKGANADVSIKQAELFLKNAKLGDILLAQLETDFETVEYALKTAKINKMITVLNPAPADALSSSLCEYCDYIIPNEKNAAPEFNVAKEIEDIKYVNDMNVQFNKLIKEHAHLVNFQNTKQTK